LGCPDADTLGALISGALSASTRAEIANHAAVCVMCHALVDGLDLVPTEPPEGESLASDRDAPLELGRGMRVGRYVIEARLGAGGMGVVYGALDSELHRRVALKLLRPDRHGEMDTVGRERLMREARTLARLSHPNVITMFDVGHHHGHLFLAMELVDGGSLSAWLRLPRSNDEIIDRLIEAGRGLAAAHAAGVVHRDVKPDNILVGSDGRARVTDFGLAHLGDTAAAPVDDDGRSANVLAAPITRTGTLMGTPVYMAPEQLARGETDASSDQWSFCATMYEALAGVRPFAGDDLAARSAAIADGRLAPPAAGRRVPAWAKSIVARGLRADPSDRWPSMDAVVGAIARGRHRRRNVAIASSVAATLAVLTTTMFAVRGGDHANALPRTPDLRTSSTRYGDGREGCDCPYSGCKNGCVSVCRAKGFTLGTVVPGISVAGRQEALVGVSGDGDTILYLAGQRCALDRLFVARRRGQTYESVDLTDQLDRRRVTIFEGCCTMAADGKTIVIATVDHKGFVRAPLVGDRVGAFDGAELGGLLPAPHLTVRHPVLTADGLTVYYRVDDTVADNGEVGPLDGTYEAARTDLRAPFGQPRRLRGRARQYEYVSGVSADNLSLFMAADYETHVMVRTDTSELFGVPGHNASPQRLYGWRAVPLADCSRILTTSTPGGCESEDIVYLDAKPDP
jgi:tRNA A-37 threonylcarbamoyl transferase component Bud32